MIDQNKLWKSVGIAVGIFLLLGLLGIGNKTGISPQAIGTPEGAVCSADKDCECWSEAGKGVGVGNCVNSKCDMAYCVDVQPLETWFKDKPWAWVKNNLVLSLGIFALLVFFIYGFSDKT